MSGCCIAERVAWPAPCSPGTPIHPTHHPHPPAAQLPSLTEGGALWFTDLTVADPTYALPALAGLSFLATIELGAADGMEGQVRVVGPGVRGGVAGLRV